MRLSEVFSDGLGLAINEFTGKVVRLGRYGAITVVFRPDTDCRGSLDSLLFDKDAVDGAWTRVVDPSYLEQKDKRARLRVSSASLLLLERLVKAT